MCVCVLDYMYVYIPVYVTPVCTSFCVCYWEFLGNKLTGLKSGQLTGRELTLKKSPYHSGLKLGLQLYITPPITSVTGCTT